jgi:hypothetical protein
MSARLIIHDVCLISAEEAPEGGLMIIAEHDDGSSIEVIIKLPTVKAALAYAHAINGVHFQCIDCGADTSNEYYSVHDRVWLKANPARNGMLCIGCLEARLGRNLTRRDFDSAPINSFYECMSPRLLDRLRRVTRADASQRELEL